VAWEGYMYMGSIITAPVPEPEEWSMVLVVFLLIAYQVQRKLRLKK
jgi:hypothetical protein